MAKAKVYTLEGKQAGEQALNDNVFAAEAKPFATHQNVKVYLANQRQGTHSTLTRAEVSGGGIKPFKQKGTGRARAGTNTSPLWPGGGIVFGPKPRDYRMSIPKKMRRNAIKTALSAKAAEDRVIVVDKLSFDKPQTKVIAKMLTEMKVAGSKILFLNSGIDRNLELSVRNVAKLTYKRAALISAYDIIHADYLLMTQAGLKECEEVWGK